MIRFFKDNGKAKLLISLALVLLIAGVGLTLYGVFVSNGEVTKLHRAVSALQNRQVADRKAAAAFETKSLNNDALNQTQWKEFRDANPHVPIPEVVEPPPDQKENKPTIIIVRPKIEPSPVPSPTPQVKTNTIIRYKAKPTPKPIKWPWSKSKK